jgi:hypothetical protein
MEEETTSTMLSLGANTAIEARISDHNPVINNGILSLNMMMQGKWNAAKKRYNNGFGLDEDQASYQARIKRSVTILGEIVLFNPSIYAIGLVEAPINPEDIAVFIEEFKSHPSLARFTGSLKPENFSSWGIMTLFDTEYFSVERVTPSTPRCLEHRLQKFILTPKHDSEKRFAVCNVHLPFDLAKSATPKELVRLIKSFFNNALPTVMMGDYNMHPKAFTTLLGDAKSFVPENNNILAKADAVGQVTHQHFDTVDGIVHFEDERIPSCPTIKFDVVNLLIKSAEIAKVALRRTALSFFTHESKVHALSLCAIA